MALDRRTADQQAQALGKVLLQEGLITENQLRYALQLQQEGLEKRRLGEILVDLGYITKRQLREIARKYNLRVPVGQILIESGLVSEEQLEEALREQQMRRQPIGEILISKGWLTEEQLAQALSRQLDYPYIIPNRRLVDRTVFQMFPETVLREHTILPLFRDGDVVTVLIHNPEDRAAVQKIEQITGGKFDLAIAPKSLIRRVLREILQEQYLFTPHDTVTEELSPSGFRRYTLAETTLQPPSSSESQVVNIVDYIISSAIRQRASDIHIESLYNKIRVRYRIDGKLSFQTDLPAHLGERIVRRIKVLAGMDISDTSNMFDGHFYVTLDNTNFDLRVSMFPTVLGCSITIRTLTREIGLKDLSDLGLNPKVLEMFKKFLDSPAGFVMFSGPTGSGKTTSLYACLNYLNRGDVKIVTVEEPVEFSIEGIAQCQLRGTQGRNVREHIRAMMHQDPDVIVLGEISDEETGEAAVHAVLSGHKVFTTIHADDAFGAIMRLMDVGLRTYLLSSTGLASISQRLVRKICPQCRQPYQPSRNLVNLFKIVDSDMDAWEFFHGKGCPACNGVGFMGRVGVFEVLALDPTIRNAILQNVNATELRSIALRSGQYLSLREAGFLKAVTGETTLEEVAGILSYSEQQAFSNLSLSEARLRAWLEAEQSQAKKE
ncbi:MAG: GspE/PulE family protein [Candidatus Sumerlaeaceae bacterium]